MGRSFQSPQGGTTCGGASLPAKNRQHPFLLTLTHTWCEILGQKRPPTHHVNTAKMGLISWSSSVLHKHSSFQIEPSCNGKTKAQLFPKGSSKFWHIVHFDLVATCFSQSPLTLKIFTLPLTSRFGSVSPQVWIVALLLVLRTTHSGFNFSN